MNFCSDCEYFKCDDYKVEGKCKCVILKDYVLACNNSCDKFSKSYRSSRDKERLYDLALKIDNYKDTLATDFIILIILIIFLFVINIF